MGFSKMQENIEDANQTFCGTPINMAPEILNRNGYNHKADIWSIGTVLYELLTGESAFKNIFSKSQLKHKMRENVFYHPTDS